MPEDTTAAPAEEPVPIVRLYHACSNTACATMRLPPWTPWPLSPKRRVPHLGWAHERLLGGEAAVLVERPAGECHECGRPSVVELWLTPAQARERVLTLLSTGALREVGAKFVSNPMLRYRMPEHEAVSLLVRTLMRDFGYLATAADAASADELEKRVATFVAGQQHEKPYAEPLAQPRGLAKLEDAQELEHKTDDWHPVDPAKLSEAAAAPGKPPPALKKQPTVAQAIAQGADAFYFFRIERSQIHKEKARKLGGAVETVDPAREALIKQEWDEWSARREAWRPYVEKAKGGGASMAAALALDAKRDELLGDAGGREKTLAKVKEELKGLESKIRQEAEVRAQFGAIRRNSGAILAQVSAQFSLTPDTPSSPPQRQQDDMKAWTDRFEAQQKEATAQREAGRRRRGKGAAAESASRAAAKAEAAAAEKQGESDADDELRRLQRRKAAHEARHAVTLYVNEKIDAEDNNARAYEKAAAYNREAEAMIDAAELLDRCDEKAAAAKELIEQLEEAKEAQATARAATLRLRVAHELTAERRRHVVLLLGQLKKAGATRLAAEEKLKREKTNLSPPKASKTGAVPLDESATAEAVAGLLWEGHQLALVGAGSRQQKLKDDATKIAEALRAAAAKAAEPLAFLSQSEWSAELAAACGEGLTWLAIKEDAAASA